tara:strand:- start:1303 stop:2982 length:1680 start_codon:yes stop_codon:yes gene_type:complete
MAERIPRYRPLGVRIASIPRVDFTVAANARSKVYGEMANTIDKITNFVIQQSEAIAAIEGAEYGAENAPTPEQIKQAYDLGQDVEELVPGGNRTIFGRAARKTALSAISSQLQTQANKEITELRTRAEIKLMPINEFGKELNAIIQGYSIPLSEISQIEAQNFRAAASTYANSAYLAHSSAMIKEMDKRVAASALYAVDTAINNVSTIVAGGPTFSPEGVITETVANKLDLNRATLLNNAVGLGASQFDAKSKQLRDAEDAAIGEFVADYVVDNNAYKDFMDNNIKDPVIKSLLANIDDRREDAVFDVVRQRITNLNSLDASNQQKIERNNKLESERLTAEIVIARADGKDDEVENLLGELLKVDPIQYATTYAAVQVEGGIDDGDVITQLNLALFNKELKLSDVLEQQKLGKLTDKTVASYLDKINAQQDELHENAMDIAKAEIGIPVGITILGNENRVSLKKVAELESQLILARRADPNLDPIKFVKERLVDLKDAMKQDLITQGTTYKNKLIEEYNLPKDSTTQEVYNELLKRGKSGVINFYTPALNALIESEGSQ